MPKTNRYPPHVFLDFFIPGRVSPRFNLFLLCFENFLHCIASILLFLTRLLRWLVSTLLVCRGVLAFPLQE